MSGIAERMAGMAGGGKRHRITAHMEKPEHKEPDGDEHDGGVQGHLKALHAEMGGEHMHIHKHDGGGYTTHHVKEDGEVHGPHEHNDTEELKDHVGKVFDGGGDGYGEPSEHGGESLV